MLELHPIEIQRILLATEIEELCVLVAGSCDEIRASTLYIQIEKIEQIIKAFDDAWLEESFIRR